MTESVKAEDTLLDRSLGWMDDLEEALKHQDTALFDELFLADSYWRDLVAFTWDTQQFWGRETLRDEWFERARAMAEHERQEAHQALQVFGDRAKRLRELADLIVRRTA